MGDVRRSFYDYLDCGPIWPASNSFNKKYIFTFHQFLFCHFELTQFFQNLPIKLLLNLKIAWPFFHLTDQPKQFQPKMLVILHRYVKAILQVFFQKIVLNKAIYNCSFANWRPIFSIFSIWVNNGIVDRLNDFGCHGHHFGGKILLP